MAKKKTRTYTKNKSCIFGFLAKMVEVPRQFLRNKLLQANGEVIAMTVLLKQRSTIST